MTTKTKEVRATSWKIKPELREKFQITPEMTTETGTKQVLVATLQIPVYESLQELTQAVPAETILATFNTQNATNLANDARNEVYAKEASGPSDREAMLWAMNNDVSGIQAASKVNDDGVTFKSYLDGVKAKIRTERGLAPVAAKPDEGENDA